MPHEITNKCPQAAFCYYHFCRYVIHITVKLTKQRNSQSHIQQLHDIAHSIEDSVASQPFSGRQHLLMGDLDFTDMTIDDNIDHLQFKKSEWGLWAKCNLRIHRTELKPRALESQEAAGCDPHTISKNEKKSSPGRANHHCLALPRVCLSFSQFQTPSDCALQSST
jgi:hypothetical protein